MLALTWQGATSRCQFPTYQTFFFAYMLCVCVCRLEGTEEKLRNRESRPEDLHIIAELREMVTEREALVKKLVVSGAIWCGRWDLRRVSLKQSVREQKKITSTGTELYAQSNQVSQFKMQPQIPSASKCAL